MRLHELSNKPGARRRKKRVGCGESSGHGKTSGRGNKGQMSRSGHKHKANFEGGQMRLIRRVPKRGFNRPGAWVLAEVNVGALARFAAGSEVTEAALREAGLVRGAVDGVKILGDGEIDRRLTVRARGFSASARRKIEAAGGACETVK